MDVLGFKCFLDVLIVLSIFLSVFFGFDIYDVIYII